MTPMAKRKLEPINKNLISAGGGEIQRTYSAQSSSGFMVRKNTDEMMVQSDIDETLKEVIQETASVEESIEDTPLNISQVE